MSEKTNGQACPADIFTDALARLAAHDSEAAKDIAARYLATTPTRVSEQAIIEAVRQDIIGFLRASNDEDCANRVEEFMTAQQIAKNIAQQAAPDAPNLTDDAIERAALKHVATGWKQLAAVADLDSDYRKGEQFKRLKAFALELFAPEAPASDPDAWAAGVLADLHRMGASPAGLSLAAQLFGVGPCPACGFRKLHCRCPAEATTANASGVRKEHEFVEVGSTGCSLIECKNCGIYLEDAQGKPCIPVSSREAGDV